VELPHDDVHEAVRAVRCRLKPHLPGNSVRKGREFIPTCIENRVARWVVEQGSKLFLAIPPEETRALLSEFREFAQAHNDDAVIVREARIRPFVRRLLELEFPHIVVLSEEELLPLEEPEAL
jgi:flagellar biosynthesis component FlhA